MKNLFFSLLLALLPTQYEAQEITPEIKTMLKNDNIAQFEKLVNKENINKCYSTEESSYSLLTLSIKLNKLNIFKKLITEKANLDLICGDKTPLMYAAKYGNLYFAKTLLENGANKNTPSSKGKTALDYAKKYDQKEIIKILE